MGKPIQAHLHGSRALTRLKAYAMADPSSFTLSESQRSGLRHLAANAAHHAYAPYSEFKVGAALLLSSGEIVAAANVENASYRLTCCAEQAAIARAVAEHGPSIRVQAVAIATLNQAACLPCGACRQTLAEFGDDTMLILYPGVGDALVDTTLGDLLPQAFRLHHRT